jgi:TATA-box binding protein (TBP) (component of TFIID and TFIIIB)
MRLPKKIEDVDPIKLDLEQIKKASRDIPPHIQTIINGTDGPIVHNIVMTARAFLPEGVTWDVMKMAYPAFGKYKGSEFATPFTLSCKIKGRRVTLLIFERGLVNVLGAKTVADATEALYSALRYLYYKIGFYMRVHDFAVHNMQATLYLNYSTDLPELEKNLACSVYNPSNIGFLKYTIPVTGGSVTFLIYPNGKIVIVKAKKIEQFEEAKRIMIPFIARFAQHPTNKTQLLPKITKPKRKRSVDKKKKKKREKKLKRIKPDTASYSTFLAPDIEEE